MGYVLALTQDQIVGALRNVLAQALPNIEIFLGQQSRLPEPASTDFAVLTPILRSSIEFPVASYQDVAFEGSVSGSTLTVTHIEFGAINVSARPFLFGVGVTLATAITEQLSGISGGAGSYRVSASQDLPARTLAAGIVAIAQPTRLTVQCDVHGPASADNCQLISTLLRSLYGADLFKAQGVDVISLYAGDPRETPFMNAEQQVEWQWSVDAVLQANQIMQAPQQYAGEAEVETPPPVELTKPF